MINLARIYNLSKTNDKYLFAELFESTISLNGAVAVRALFSYKQFSYEKENDPWARKILAMPREESGKINFDKLRKIIETNLGPIILKEKSKNPKYSYNYFLPKAIKQKNETIDPYIRGNYENIELPELPERENTETEQRIFDESEQILATYYFSKTNCKNFITELNMATLIHGRQEAGNIINTLPYLRMGIEQQPYHIQKLNLSEEEITNLDHNNWKKILENHLEPLLITYRLEPDNPQSFFIPRVAKQEEGIIDPYIREEFFEQDIKKIKLGNCNPPFIEEEKEDFTLDEILNKETSVVI